MMSEAEIRNRGMDALIAGLGREEAQKFLELLANDRSDYTTWRKYLFHGMTLEEINTEAKELWKNNSGKESIS